MCRYPILIVGALVLATSTVSAETDFTSANALVPGCRAHVNNQPSDLFMEGVSAGIIDALFFMDKDSCPPRGVTNDQLARVVVQYIDSQPARLHEPFRVLALEAMRKAWPCQR